MASVRYIVLAACQRAGLVAQAGFENEAAAWIRKQGSVPCAYVGYRRGMGVPGYDNVSVLFGGSEPQASLSRVRDELEKPLEFRSLEMTTVDGYLALVMTARVRKRVYNIFGGAIQPAPPTLNYMYFEAQEADSTVSLLSMMPTAPNLEYSTDGANWQEWQHTTAEEVHTFDTITLGAVGDRVYLRGNNPSGFNDIENVFFSAFSLTGKIAAGGNAQSLVDGDTPTLEAKAMPLFSDTEITEQYSDVLTQAPELPATTLAFSCYGAMFYGCTGLTQAPELPATTLAFGCYSDMFYGCTGLTQAPELPATTLADACYNYMFYGCTGLTQAPELPATTLADGCYVYMFGECTFDMSTDGTTFSIECAATIPQTVGDMTFSTPYDLADWMGNTNGFTTP